MLNYRDDSPQILCDFLSYHETIKGQSGLTVHEYYLDLRTFFRYLIAKENGIDPESEEFLQIDISTLPLSFFGSIRTSEIYAFLQYSGSVRKNMWAAKARKLAAIRMLYRYLVNKTKQLDQNPAADIESPKPRRSLPKFLSLEESLMLLDAVKKLLKRNRYTHMFCKGLKYLKQNGFKYTWRKVKDKLKHRQSVCFVQ